VSGPDDDLADVVQLELRLLEPAVRNDPATARALPYADFREHGASRRVWDRESITAATAGGTQRIGARQAARCGCATRARGWVLFHQGTLVPTGADAMSGVIVQSGCSTATSWQVPEDTLADGTRYTWTVRTHDRASEAYAPVGRFKVDLRVGDPGPAPTDTVGQVTVNLANGNAIIADSSKTLPAVGGTVGFSFTYNSLARSRQGLTAEYYDDGNHSQTIDSTDGAPLLVRTEPTVDVKRDGSPLPGVVPADWYVARYTGFLTLPTNGAAPSTASYQFSAIHDDKATITVAGQPMYSAGCCSATPAWQTPTVSLTTGTSYPITVEYSEATGPARLQLLMRKAGDTTNPTGTVVPAAALSTAGPAPLPEGWTFSADLNGTVGYSRAETTDTAVVLTDSAGGRHTWTKTTSTTGSAGTAGYTPPTGETGVLAMAATGELP